MMMDMSSNLSPTPVQQDRPSPPVVERAVLGLNEKTMRPRVEVMGRFVDLMTGAEVLAWIQYAARGRRKAIIGTHNLHSLFLAERHPQMAHFYDMADVVQVDSLPLLKFASMTGKPMGPEYLSSYACWRDDFWALCQRFGLRVYYLGGDQGVATGAIRMIEMAYPDVRFSGRDRNFDDTSDSAQNQKVVRTIRRFAPDILLVGLGMPRQEVWIAENYSDLPPCVVMPIGDALDIELGERKQRKIRVDKAVATKEASVAGANFYELCCLIKPAVRDLLKRTQ